MELYPAIDLRGGRCVRLYQGDYERETVYGDPIEQATSFVAAGARWLHVVDLDAARSGELSNRSTIEAICSSVAVPVQVGGGVRSEAAADSLFDVGVARVVIGTAALENPGLVATIAATRPVAVGLDARNGAVATHGWTETTGETVTQLAARFADVGVAALVVTEITRDGTLQGPDVAGLASLLAHTDLPVIASGGVGTIADLDALAAVEHGAKRLAGAIVGRAIYEGAVSVEDALVALDSGSES